jgi:hypothetical protein
MRSAKTKLKRKKAGLPKAPHNSSSLRGWSAIARFLGMPNSTIHRWAKEGMPVHREGRNVVAHPEELNQWLQQTSGEAAGVHVVRPSSDLLRDLRASLAAQKATQVSIREPNGERVKHPSSKARKRNTSPKS